MALRGFRLYTIERTIARTRGRLEFGGDLQPSPLDDLHEQLLALEGRTFVRDATYVATAPDEEGSDHLPARTPVLRVDWIRRRASSMEAAVSYGRIGDYGFAMSADGDPDFPLQRHAASRPYRVVIHLPRAGTMGAMVSEVVGRTHAGELLLKRLSVENFRRAAQGPDDGHWHRWLPNGIFDEGRIEEVLTTGAVEGLRLRRRAVGSSGVRTSHDLYLTQNGIPARHVDAARRMVSRWLKRHLDIKSGKADGGHDAVSALVQLVDGEVEGLNFTDGVLTFRDDGKVQSLGPSSLDRILTYPMSDGDHTIEALRSASNDRLRPLMAGLRVPIDLE